MERKTVDLWVGIFVAAGLIGLLVLALKVGNASSVRVSDGYTITANFDNIGGLRARAPVRSAGVLVGRVEYVIAGHHHIAHYRVSASEPQRLGQRNFPLGLFDGRTYHTETIALERGDLLVLYSDGLNETADASDTELGHAAIERTGASLSCFLRLRRSSFTAATRTPSRTSAAPLSCVSK